MRRRLTIATTMISVFAWAVLSVRPAVGQEPMSDGGAPLSNAPGDADAAVSTSPTTPSSAPAPASAAPTADAGAPANAAIPVAIGQPRFRYTNTWDLNLEGGAGYVMGDIEKWSGFVRARPGALIVRNDNFYQFGATAEYLGVLRRPAFGVQAEYLHLQLGVWLQVGASLDTKGRPGAMAAMGLSIFGVEAQVREFDQAPDATVAVIGKIRVPIGILVYGLTSKH